MVTIHINVNNHAEDILAFLVVLSIVNMNALNEVIRIFSNDVGIRTADAEQKVLKAVLVSSNFQVCDDNDFYFHTSLTTNY